MEFGWFNLTGLVIDILLIVPSLIFIRRHKGTGAAAPGPIRTLEQIGRWGALILMVVPVGIKKFGFASVGSFLLWAIVCFLLLAAYFLFWRMYSKNPGYKFSALITVSCGLVFILRGVFLRYALLSILGFFFLVGHLYTSYRRSK